MFVTLHKTPGGQEVMVNTDHVVSVKDRAHDMNPVITLSYGIDFEVDETFDEVVMIVGAGS